MVIPGAEGAEPLGECKRRYDDGPGRTDRLQKPAHHGLRSTDDLAHALE